MKDYSIKLFYSKQDKVYFFTDLEQDCDYCKARIEEAIVIKVGWDRLGSDIKYYCVSCKNKNMSFARAIQEYIAIVNDNIEDSFTPIAFTKPSLQNVSNMSTFDVANINIDGESTTDKTVYANRESLEGATIGNQSLIEDLEVSDKKLLSIDEGFNLLDSLAKAQSLIEQGEQKQQIENKKQ